MKKLLSALVIAAIAILINTTGYASEKHPFGIDDMLKMYRLSDPRISPDGKWVVFSAAKPDLEKNKIPKDLWMVSTDGKKLKRLTDDSNADYGALWLPDGRGIAFIRVHKDSAQIWFMDPFSGGMKQLSHLPLDADNLGVSPDGKWFSFTIDVYPDCASLKCTVERDKKKKDDPVKARVYDDLLFRHWDHWEDGKRGHLFIMSTAGGDPIDLTPGLESDVPTRPWGGPEEISFSPNGDEIAYATKAEANPALHTNTDIFSVNLKTMERKCLTCENKGWDNSPSYSPDGRYLAYLSMERAGYESDKQRIMLLDRETGDRRDLTKDWDRSAYSISWAPDGKTIYAPASDEGEQPIFSLNVERGGVKRVVKDHQNGAISATAGLLVFLRDGFTFPTEIFTGNPDGTDLKKITGLNDAILADVVMSEPEKFWFKGAGGDMIQGWFFKPVDFEEGKKYPLAYFIHGGPQWPWNDRFHYRWNMEIAAGAGYAAATVNFHGSPGFGQGFTDSIRGDWGGKPYRDIMKGLDYVLKGHGWIDSKRVCALGASYGGYMINWIEGQTDRFACLVNHDGEFSSRSAYFNTEELWFPEWDMEGTPFDNPKNFERWSPDRFVKKWKTPMLVIHGANDYRVADTEGLSAFTALRRLGVPARLIYFPDENHWVLKPQNSRMWHDEVYSWMVKWTSDQNR